jgi:hypothetical protein
MIDQANAIIEEYAAEGYTLSLRQIFYQFVSRDLLPSLWTDPATGSTNNVRSYIKLGVIISDGRMAGLIDWDAIKDRTREKGSNSHWDSPEDIIDSISRQYRLDTRIDQPIYIEVLVEKDALEGIVERSCRLLDVPWLSCRGYLSMTTMREAAERYIEQEEEGKETVILHFGDHDPSGIDMTRDIQDRLAEFGSQVRVMRIALNRDQIDRYNPPPNPAKETDSRCAGYISVHGNESWELDALDPRVISELIENEILNLTDDVLRDVLVERQAQHRRQLVEASKRWPDIVAYLKKTRKAPK